MPRGLLTLCPGTQGLGYVAGFLLLVVEPDQVARMLHRIGSSPKYTPGYWKGQPECFVRDAMVRHSCAVALHPALCTQAIHAPLRQHVGWHAVKAQRQVGRIVCT